MLTSVNREIVVDVLQKIVNDENYRKSDNFFEVINTLVKPFSKKARPKEAQNLLNDILKKCGICQRCKIYKVKNTNDCYCKFCKSALKEEVKNASQN